MILATKSEGAKVATYVRITVPMYGEITSGAKRYKAEICIVRKRIKAIPIAERSFAVNILHRLRG